MKKNSNSLKAFFAFLFSSFRLPVFDFKEVDMTWEDISYDLIFKKDPAIREYYRQKLAAEE